jgi:uncharacterized protein (TIGR00369 family)
VKIAPELVRNVVEKMIPFNTYLGIECAGIGPGYCRMEVPFRDELIGDPLRKALHGGVISAVVDACGGAAVWTKMEPADAVSTIDLRVDFLRPGGQERLVVEAHLVRLGNRVAVVDMRAFHPSAPERTIATGKGVYNVRRRKHPEAEPKADG